MIYNDSGKNNNLIVVNFKNVPNLGIQIPSGPFIREGIYVVLGNELIKPDGTKNLYTLNCIDIDWNLCLVDEETTLETTGDLIRWIKRIVSKAGNFDKNKFSLEDTYLYYDRELIYSLDGIPVADGSITTLKLADKAVTTPKIANEAVTKEKLASGLLQYTNKITDSSNRVNIGTLKFGNDSNIEVYSPKGEGAGIANVEYEEKEDIYTTEYGTLIFDKDTENEKEVTILGPAPGTANIEITPNEDITDETPGVYEIASITINEEEPIVLKGKGSGVYEAGDGIEISEDNKISLKTGFVTNDNEKKYKVEVDSNGNPFVSVPWIGSIAAGFEVKLSKPTMPVGTDSNGNLASYIDSCTVQAYVNNEEVSNFTVTVGTISRTNGASTSGASATISGKTVNVTLLNITSFVGNSIIIPLRATLSDAGINYDCNIVCYGVASGKDGRSIQSLESRFKATSTNSLPSTPTNDSQWNDWKTLANSGYSLSVPYLWKCIKTVYKNSDNSTDIVYMVEGPTVWGQKGEDGVGLTAQEKQELLQRTGDLEDTLDDLLEDLLSFKNGEANRILGEVNTQLATLKSLKDAMVNGKISLGSIYFDSNWNNDLNAYLQTVGLLERNQDSNGNATNGYRASYTTALQDVNTILLHADAIEELFELPDADTPSKISSMLAAIDANTEWRGATGEGGKATASLTTFFADSGIVSNEEYQEGKAKVINFVSSGFKTESNKYVLDEDEALYEALSEVFALHKGDNADSYTKDELLAYIRAKVNSDKQLASAALVADTVMYEVEMERATDSSKGNLYVNEAGEPLYKDGSIYKKVSDDTVYEPSSGEQIINYMIPKKNEYGAFIYEQDSYIDENGDEWYLWVGGDENLYKRSSKYIYRGDTLYRVIDGLECEVANTDGDSLNVPTGEDDDYTQISITPKRKVKSHTWSGVLSESTMDSAMASLFARNENTKAKAAVTAWAIGDDTFLDAVAEKVDGGKAEITLAAMAKNEAALYWDKDTNSWKSNTPDDIKNNYSSPDDIDLPGAFIKLAINSDNKTKINLEADEIEFDSNQSTFTGVVNVKGALEALNGRFSTVSASNIHTYTGDNENSNGYHIVIDGGEIVGYNGIENTEENVNFLISSQGGILAGGNILYGNKCRYSDCSLEVHDEMWFRNNEESNYTIITNNAIQHTSFPESGYLDHISLSEDNLQIVKLHGALQIGGVSVSPKQIYMSDYNNSGIISLDTDTDGNYLSVKGFDKIAIGTNSTWDWIELIENDDLAYIRSDLIVNGTVTDNSDATLKDIVSDITLTVEQVANAPAVNFTWKKDADKKDKKVNVGTLAQYWNVVLPEAVKENKDGKLSMAYSNAAMVSSIITAREVVVLKLENQTLKERLSALEEKINLLIQQ